MESKSKKIKYKAFRFVVILLVITACLGVVFIKEDIVSATEWWNTEWEYSKQIVISHSLVEDTLINFPIFVNISNDIDLHNHAQDDGDDLVFMNATNETQFNHEIEYYNNDSNYVNASVWVNITSLSGDSDTVIYMYYGNTTCSSQENIEGTWDSDYTCIHHFNESSGTQYDSTDNNADSTFIDVSTQGTANGIVDGCNDFDDASTDYMTIGNTPVEDNTKGTIELWCNVDEYTSGGAGYFLFHRIAGTNSRLYLYEYDDGATHIFRVGFANKWDIATSHTYTRDTWYHFVLAWTGANYDVYVDKDSVVSGTQIQPTGTATSVDLGSYTPDNEYIDGMIDELRVSKVQRSSEWINTTYNTISDSSNFIDIGTENSVPTGNTPPELSSPSVYPTSGVDSYTVFYFNVTWTDDGQDPTDGYLKVNVSRTGWYTNQSMSWISGDNATGAIYSYNTQLTTGSYTYNFYAYDGTNYNSSGPHSNPTVEAQSYSFSVTTASVGINFTCWTLSISGVGLTTEYNVSEDNQTALIPAINISNTGNVPLNFSINWTGNPGSGITMKYNFSESAPYPSINTIAVDPSSTKIITNLLPNSYEEIWLWLDFVSVTAQSSSQDVKLWSDIYES